MKTITVREYARLTTQSLEINTLDKASISPSAFEWLCALHAKWGRKENTFINIEGTKTLRLNSYVGMLQSPCGTTIEILPKIHDDDQEIEKTRKILWNMLLIYLGKDKKESEWASIKCLKKPLAEWLISFYLQELAQLLKKGLHSKYTVVDEERTFIRGQINIAKQVRQPLHRQHLTHVRHNIFSVNRAENRLLRSALLVCHKATQDSENWMLATQLIKMTEQVPQSQNIKNDIKLWQNARHMSHYMKIKPWCELILQSNVPFAQHDNWQGISLLFPMEKLFESFVVASLRKRLACGVKLTAQSSKHHLCTHKKKDIFNLKPDILLEKEERAWVLDAKWKCLNPEEPNYNLSQGDMYQLFAYGHKYMKGQGDMALVFPATKKFRGIEQPFEFDADSKLRLFALACDPETGEFYPQEAVGVFWGGENVREG